MLKTKKGKKTIALLLKEQKDQFVEVMGKFSDTTLRNSPVNGYYNLAKYCYEQIINILIEKNEELNQFYYTTHFCNGIFGVGKTKFGETLANESGYLNEKETVNRIWEHIETIIDDLAVQDMMIFAPLLEKEIKSLEEKQPCQFSFLFQNPKVSQGVQKGSFKNHIKYIFLKLMGLFLAFFLIQISLFISILVKKLNQNS